MYGEPAHPILRALQSLELSPADDEGFCEFQMRLTSNELGPFARAVMRAQAGLLLDEADQFEPGAPMIICDDLLGTALLAVASAALEAIEGTPPGARRPTAGGRPGPVRA